MYNPETTYLGLGNGRCNGLLYGEGCVGGGNRAFDCIYFDLTYVILFNCDCLSGDAFVLPDLPEK